MAIPAFNPQGFLPPGEFFAMADETEAAFYGHDCDMAEVEARFVDDYANSITRSLLFREVSMLLTWARKVVVARGIWIAGEFVTDITDPKDLYVVLQVAGTWTANLNSEDVWLVSRLFSEEAWAVAGGDDLQVTTNLLAVYPPQHFNFDSSEAELLLARYLASRPREDSDGGAGYLEVFVGEEVTDALIETATH